MKWNGLKMAQMKWNGLKMAQMIWNGPRWPKQGRNNQFGICKGKLLEKPSAWTGTIPWL